LLDCGLRRDEFSMYSFNAATARESVRMCDTLVALSSFTRTGEAIFAKNSDRERNEAQIVEMTPRTHHPRGASLEATYITIPQVQQTFACLLCRPYWMWGAEMGANEHGLVIGNEAVHATVPAQRRRALTGMDFVRLALERTATAEEAVDLIVALLERHGQGGDCGHLGRFYYHNSFLVADRSHAVELETVGRWWAVERVRDVRAISNALSIGRGYDRLSDDLAGHARSQGWLAPTGRLDFAGRLIDEDRDHISFGRGRCDRSAARLEGQRGVLTAGGVMAILRDHGPEAQGDDDWSPARTAHRTICMHAGAGARRSQTTGSLVSEMGEGPALHWVTASAAPCLSVFKPVLFETGLPDQGPAPTGRWDTRSRWWRHERFHRAVLTDFARRSEGFGEARDKLEAGFAERMNQAIAAGLAPDGLRIAVNDCWREADAMEEDFARSVAAAPGAAAQSGGYRQSWARLSQVAGLPKT
jgi:secernin